MPLNRILMTGMSSEEEGESGEGRGEVGERGGRLEGSMSSSSPVKGGGGSHIITPQLRRRESVV